jgi:hypothetical protein
MALYLHERKIRVAAHPRFAEPFRDQLCESAGRLAAEPDIEFKTKVAVHSSLPSRSPVGATSKWKSRWEIW